MMAAKREVWFNMLKLVSNNAFLDRSCLVPNFVSILLSFFGPVRAWILTEEPIWNVIRFYTSIWPIAFSSRRNI